MAGGGCTLPGKAMVLMPVSYTHLGQVRHIILTEQGFTAYSPTRGAVPELQ